ncbi:DUF4376 domain-containing protein [Pseudomonas sp. ANT_J12]|uniref:DUF4376 domain-containing protein n=1 Tax=Pseudomonas sp. ANT_J12 TaxID=2597351 RepID=UPI0011F0C5DC|nr:DUF4376 domain-containing protein [Pseudomonas sp. ANT_J12]KAA0996812.1 DUF4376 domain-containing protein [Pseudomonas sp. ANT_J12]
MKYYVTFGSELALNGRYNTDLHQGSIPDGAIEVDADLFFRTISEADGTWSLQEGQILKLPFADVVLDRAALIAEERFSREASGVAVDGLQVETTRDSQALIAGTGLSAILDPEYRCNFKTLNGFVEIGAEQIITIAKAVRAHVQACFDRELTLLLALEAGTYHDEMLGEGWPDSSPPASNPALQ